MALSASETERLETFSLQKEILLNDWASGRTAIRDLDGATFKIKGWAITVFGATLAASVTLKTPSLLLFSILSSTLFWALDGLFKSFQHRFILRDVEISRYLSSPDLLKDQKEGEISSVPIAAAFYDLDRLSDFTTNELPGWLEMLCSRLGSKRESLVDLMLAMKLTNVKALYLSLICLSIILWLGFLTFMTTQ
ncbi:MAG: hypothetical protein ACSHXB_14005 [Sulfitobacter sp.]